MENCPEETLNGNNMPHTEMEANCYTSDLAKLLSKGLVQMFDPNLNRVKQQLNELTEKQNVLVEQLHDENLKICSAKNCEDLNHMFTTIKSYQVKLMNIKREMRNLHDKSNKLRKRASRLQQYKEKETYAKIQQVQQEQDLIGKKD